MTYEEFFRLVRDMRDAQKNYFSERDHNWLKLAKDLERQVDAQLKKNPAQGELFKSS